METNSNPKGTPLSNYFTKTVCNRFSYGLGITTVEEAQSLSDENILRIHGLGLKFLQRLRNIKLSSEVSIPIRQWCAMCGQIHKVDFHVPDQIWKEAIHPNFQNSVVCLNCFMSRADEKFLEWDKEIVLRPCSFYTQRQLQLTQR
jgi:hypothetical protein